MRSRIRFCHHPTTTSPLPPHALLPLPHRTRPHLRDTTTASLPLLPPLFSRSRIMRHDAARAARDGAHTRISALILMRGRCNDGASRRAQRRSAHTRLYVCAHNAYARMSLGAVKTRNALANRWFGTRHKPRGCVTRKTPRGCCLVAAHALPLAFCRIHCGSARSRTLLPPHLPRASCLLWITTCTAALSTLQQPFCLFLHGLLAPHRTWFDSPARTFGPRRFCAYRFTDRLPVPVYATPITPLTALRALLPGFITTPPTAASHYCANAYARATAHAPRT